MTQRTPDRARGDADRRRAAALATWCHAASVQDRDGAIPLLRASRRLCPFVERAFAAERIAAATLTATIEIVRKQAGQVGFAVQLWPLLGALELATAPSMAPMLLCRSSGF